MDYCDPCQRHLNGALACPGCGTPARSAAEATAAYARVGTGTGETPGYGAAYGTPSEGYAEYGVYVPSQGHGAPQEWYPQPEAEPASDPEPEPEPGPEPALEEEDPEPGGRAARRRARGGAPVGPGDADASRRDRKAAAHRCRR